MPRSLPKTEQNSNISFVLEVEKYPCLYNYTLEEYSKRDAVDASWQKVAKASGDAVSNCKERWKNLRTVFVRKRKLPPGGSSRKSPYYLNDVMQFIVPYIKFQNYEDTPSNLRPPVDDMGAKLEEDQEHSEVEDDGTDERQLDDEVEKDNNDKLNKHSGEGERRRKECLKLKSNGKVSNQKRKATSTVDDVFMEYLQEQKVNQRDSARKTFLLSLVPEVDAMTDIQFRQFRRHVIDAIDIAEGSF